MYPVENRLDALDGFGALTPKQKLLGRAVVKTVCPKSERLASSSPLGNP
jgi:hypothetical protein